MKLTRLIAAVSIIALAPAVAEAHLVASGMGPVYDGISHFALSPEDYLPVIALGLFAGLRGAQQARVALASLPSAWFAGGLAALLGAAIPPLWLSAATAVLLLFVGGLLAANQKTPLAVCIIAAVLLGIVRGLADLLGATLDAQTVLTLAGMTASVFVVFALAASLTLPLERLWLIVAARVGGSWLAALGLLLAGWILRYGSRAL